MSSHEELQQQRKRFGSDVDEGPACDGERDDDEQSIIDVFEFDDTAHDRWLCSVSRRNSSEAKVEDMDAWLHADLSESESVQPDNNSRKFIDTRTFTRMKRRSNRLSYETAEASVSPETKTFSLSNVWKNQLISESPIQSFNNNNDKEQNVQKEGRDNIPMMLRPKTNQVLAALLSESPTSITSQTSMEAFMNMARSKEAMNSLRSNMSDPEVSPLLMNISQPSLLYSSIISDGKGDEIAHSPAIDSFIDSQILTDSMMEASMFKEVQDTTMLANFLKQNNYCTDLEDKTFCESSNSFDTNSKTFVNDPQSDKTFSSITNKYNTYAKNSNETFVTNENFKMNDSYINFPSPISKNDCINSTKIISSQENLLNKTQVITAASSTLNSSKILSPDYSVPVLLKKEDLLSKTHTINSENKTDVTFDLKSASSSVEKRLDATFQASDFSAGQIPQFGSTVNGLNSLDETFNVAPNLRAELLQEVQRSSGNKFDSTFTNPQLPNIETKLDVTYDHLNVADPLDDAKNLDATYVQVPSLHQPESQSLKKCLDVTYDSTQVNSKLSNAASQRRISYAKPNSAESQAQPLDPNRFNTFRKNSKIGNRLSKVSQVPEHNANKVNAVAPLQPHVPTTKSNDALYQRRFDTFSKRMSTVKNNMYSEMETAENQPDEQFAKPMDKLPRKIKAPRQLSKLPSLFQKSNPNLGSSIKPLEIRTLESDAGFSKGSEPNIASNVGRALGRFKSERLLPMKHNIEFQAQDGTSRSMESIESTASAHSAPDLDDRLSICSDSSRASYTVKPRNLEKLKKLASMEEGETYNASTPRLRQQILENTWVEEKNLPSPIHNIGLSVGTESGDSRSTSPTDSAEFNAKTSSPLTISPTSSDQALNVIGNDDGGIEAAKENIQSVQNVRPKQIKVPSSVSTTANTNATKLRRPTNWTGAPSKIPNGTTSGIPRPASRIPAPKFARPSLK